MFSPSEDQRGHEVVGAIAVTAKLFGDAKQP